MRLPHPGQTPLVINETPSVCPDCGSDTAIYSVKRDMGSERYCGICVTCRWPNPNHTRGKRLLEELQALPGTPVVKWEG